MKSHDNTLPPERHVGDADIEGERSVRHSTRETPLRGVDQLSLGSPTCDSLASCRRFWPLIFDRVHLLGFGVLSVAKRV